MSVSCQSLSYVLSREEDRKRETVSMCWPVHPKSPPRESAEKRQLLNSSDTPDTPSHSCLSFFFFGLSFLKCITSLWCFSSQEMNGTINMNGNPVLFYGRTFITTRLDALKRHTHINTGGKENQI